MNTIASTPSNGLLSIGKSAVAAQQQMLNTTSNNIANVGTEGYVRQRSQTYTSLLNYGVGETITERLNNTYSQQEVWRDTSISNYYDTVYGQLSSIDKYLSSESTGMSGAILDTLKSLQSAVNDPSSLAQRTEFIGSVNGLVNRFNTLYTDVNNTQQFNTSRIGEDIGTVNEIIAKIANLNKAVQATLGEKSSVAYNLQDQRDAAIQELSKYMDIRTYNQKDGVILVTLSTGHSLVLQDGNHAVLEEVPGKFDYSNSQMNLTYKNSRGDTSSETTLDNTTIGGELGGLLEVRTEIEEVEKSLGQLAIAMADAFNQGNHNGVDLNGNLGGDIFTIAPATTIGSNSNSVVTTTVNFGEGANVTTNDFYIEFTSATEYNVYTVARDNAERVEILTGQTDTELNLSDYGITIKFDDTAKAKGDYFFIQPTLAAAFDIKPAITSESQLALASALKAEVDPSNFGKATAVISNIYNTSSIDTSTGELVLKAGTPASIIIDNNGDYEVFDSNGNSLGVADKSCNGVNILAHLQNGGSPVYDPIETLGYDITVNGKVFAGDQFNIEVNSNGIGDNSNGLAMCEMQTADLVASGTSNGVKQTFVERYSLLTSEFGTVVNNASANATASEAKLAQSVAQYENITGVSLDEEAANLVKFQQYYQAAARIISASQTVFDALISAV
ncbi:MAG: flagellar hook-associated protein FlgK [Succinivibrionaceae bacterium]|nr:flagellar hook-associated protein FlgK [Succinivibrionaceae bacterium]